MAQVVYTGADARAMEGGLFAGKKFWLSQKLPSRSRFVDLVKVYDNRSLSHSTNIFLTVQQINGGAVVPIEQHADIKIVDPFFKRNLPPDSYALTHFCLHYLVSFARAILRIVCCFISAIPIPILSRAPVTANFKIWRDIESGLRQVHQDLSRRRNRRKERDCRFLLKMTAVSMIGLPITNEVVGRSWEI
jgi:hypothetical protein